MNTTIKKISVLLLAGMALLSVSSCCKDKDKDKEQLPTNPSIIKGSISTSKVVDNKSVVNAIAFGDIEDVEVVGTGLVKNKTFSVSLKTPQTLIYFAEAYSSETISMDNPKVKIAGCSILQLINNGEITDALMCSKGKPQYDNEAEDLHIKSGILYMYADSDAKIKGSFLEQRGFNSQRVNTTFNLVLKKGWNIVRTSFHSKKATFTSISDISSDYKWYLMSDIMEDIAPTPQFKFKGSF